MVTNLTSNDYNFVSKKITAIGKECDHKMGILQNHDYEEFLMSPYSILYTNPPKVFSLLDNTVKKYEALLTFMPREHPWTKHIEKLIIDLKNFKNYLKYQLLCKYDE
tara:strand:+ start:1251 stop:1571 length:321 start_codon:yes stop_codon:yes gene_type:complete